MVYQVSENTVSTSGTDNFFVFFMHLLWSCFCLLSCFFGGLELENPRLYKLRLRAGGANRPVHILGGIRIRNVAKKKGAHFLKAF